MFRPPRSTFHTGPVTALCVVNNNILAGVGSSLYLYSLDQGCCTQQCSKVLPCTNIHGIRPATGESSDRDISLLCAFGGKCLRVVKYLSETLQCEEKVISVPDWIWDVSWLYKAGEVDGVVVITAHNVVHRLDLTSGRTVQTVACVENSILYCAKFINSSWEDLIVASGTVFNQVLLWSPVGDRNDASQALVIHRLVGHEGVIFSVEFCPRRRWICSVSDDRSVRVWQLKFPGFIDGVISLDQWKHCSSEQLYLLYGHSARVWDVKILTHNLISIGEDSTCCVWDDQGKIIHKFKGHKGKSIWSLAVDNKGKFVVTGGGDNSIRLWKLDMIQMQTNDTLTCTTLAVPNTQGIKADFPRVVTMLDWNHTLVLTNEGVLQLYALDTLRWRTLMYDAAFRSYTAVVVCPYKANLVALGNISGMLRIFFCRNLGIGTPVQDADWLHKDWQVHDGKIFSLQWLSHDKLLTTGPDGQIKYWEFELTDCSASLELGGRFVLPPCKHRWISAAGIVEESDTLLLICGDRGGTVHVYQLYTEQQDGAPIQSFPKIHGKTGVTDICCHGNIIYTAGRDGFYNQYELAGNQLSLLHKNKVHKGFDWLDKLDIDREDGDTLIYGFHSNNFVLWSVHNNQQLVQIACGGGHRAWDCHVIDNTVRFVYIKSGDVIYCETKLWSNQILLKESLHGREITNVQHLMSYTEDRHTVEVIATGSEDTQINLLCIAPNSHGIREMKVLQTLQGHISSVRTLTHCNSGLPCQQVNSSKKLLFSGGGRAQLMVWRVETSKLRTPNVKCSFESLLNYRMEHWNRKHRKPWKQLAIKPNPETRFMDLAVIPIQDVWLSVPPGVFCVIAACSDGYVRFYLFCERERTLTLLGQSLYHNHCVLKVNIMHYQEHLIAMSAGTDGCIAFWDITNLYQHYLHQSEQLLQMNDGVPNNRTKVTCDSSGATKVKPDSDYFDTKLNHSFVNVCDNVLSEAEDRVQDDHVAVEHEPSEQEKDASSDSSTAVPPSDKYVHDTQEQMTCKSGSTEEDLSPIFVIPSHQSGINSLHSVHIEGTDQVLIASGGDDNAVRLSKVTIATGSAGVHITQNATGIIPSAHAAQITGIHLINKDQLISASVDQRLCMWDIVAADDDFQLKQKWCRFVDVADLSSISVWKTDRLNILTAGVGLELLTTDSTND